MEEKTLAEASLVLDKNRQDDAQSLNYAPVYFSVPRNCRCLTLRVRQTSGAHAQIPLFVFDSRRMVRMMRTEDGTEGITERILKIGAEEASRGAIPGPLAPGPWVLLMYKRRMLGEVALKIRISAEGFPPGQAPDGGDDRALRMLSSPPAFSKICLEKGRRWYRGELHVHSTESTGKGDIPTIQETARNLGLDFIALTDHFSASHWTRIAALPNLSSKPLFLQSMEIAGDYGHANVHAVSSWPLPLVDDAEALCRYLNLETPPTMERIADQVHAQGGLFCINHALSGIFGWRYRDFPMDKADLFEILCTPDHTTSFLYPTLWDTLLCQGSHITGVGSSDSHHPSAEGPWKLGVISTWVYAEELSQKALIAGLKQGRVYVSSGSSRLEFTALTPGGQKAMMGDTLFAEKGTLVGFDITLARHPSGNLIIISDGFIYDVVFFEANPNGEDRCHFDFPCTFPPGKNYTYLRIEFHADLEKSRFYGMLFRNHQSARLLSNPIWIEAPHG
ncbi:MAG: CehA/McbA family metallohydrolase [Treponema sp.]|jgi:hypothetical protein|nr:CehA/McbA family metallohydrolase [Treponema sp.]